MTTTRLTSEWTSVALRCLRPGLLLLVCCALVLSNGCSGCGPEDPLAKAKREAAEAERKKKEAERNKPDFEATRLLTLPGVIESDTQYVKPGHWFVATQQMKTNHFDFVGQTNTTIVDQQDVPYPIFRTPFLLISSRPVALSKGRPKNVERTFFVPLEVDTLQLQTELQERSGLSAMRQLARLDKMPSYQYRFVVLASEPTRYSFLKTIDSINVPFSGESEFDVAEQSLHYRVDQPIVGRTIPLPDNPLTWTSIAFILWDDIDPQLFTPEQERALIDWLHWGGQLVISGPDSLDTLRSSFLGPYLPATNSGARAIGGADLAELNEGWTISTPEVAGEPITPISDWSGIKLELHPEAQSLPSTGGLLVERAVGRGRIVVSAMQLSETELINWQFGFESWFNACVLRRPARQYTLGPYGGVTLNWADEQLQPRRLDARLTTNLRFFARDLGVETSYRFVETKDDDLAQYSLAYDPNSQLEPMLKYEAPPNAGSIGAWNDASATAMAARDSLREAAGVEVPGASFVVACLAIYLIALVPLNWLFFYALRHVEWAWIAAPVIAVAGTFVVVHRAQLDIGFVRAQTEIGLVELQTEHPRAHLSRYTALYTSLSTTYDAQFDDLTALAVPFVRPDFQLLRGQSRTPVDFMRHENVRLSGLQVSSATTEMIHSEQMIELGDGIRLGRTTATNRPQIENLTPLNLRSVCLVQRPAEARRGGAALEGMWIGELRGRESSPISLSRLTLDDQETPFADERTTEASYLRREQLNLEPMFQLALDAANFEPGEMRLVARVDEILPGETISPSASQMRGATLVVAHLKYGPPPVPRPDVNTRQEFNRN